MAKVGCPYARVSRLAQHSANTSQPGSANAYKPINTIAGVQGTNPNHGKGRTYGKIDRNAARISEREALFPGSQSYRQQQLARKTGNVSEYGVVHSSPAKRRKTENPNATASSPVEIPDDEDEEVWSARRTSTPQACSIMSSGSPRSTISKHSATGPKTASQATSEFANTDELLDPRRHRPRPRRLRSKGPSEHRKTPPAGVPFLGAGTQPQEQHFSIHEDSESPPKTARSFILNEHEQGVNQRPSRNKAQRSTGVTSNHFAPDKLQTRINESTEAEATASEQHNGVAGDLRHHRYAEQVTEDLNDPIQDHSEDELARVALNTSKSQRRKSPTKTGKRGNDARQQKELVGRTYRLRYFQTYGSANDKTGLILRHTETPNILRITGMDVEGNIKTLHHLNLHSVVKAEADNTHRMRLTGSKSQGKTYWFDLHFENNQEFIAFRKLVFDRLPQSVQITKGP